LAVVRQHMASIAQLRWSFIGFACQQGLGIGAGGMGLVAELVATKDALGTLSSLRAPSPSPGPVGGGGGSSWPSIRLRVAYGAQGCSNVPSTEKYSSLSSGMTSGAPISISRVGPTMTSSLSSRSRFFENVVGCQIASSGLKPTNQRSRRL
jgi:hypothetical protein